MINLAKELMAMVYLAGCLNQAEIGNSYQKEADELLQSIREHCWDPKDGFYYSVDLNLRPATQPAETMRGSPVSAFQACGAASRELVQESLRTGKEKPDLSRIPAPADALVPAARQAGSRCR